VNYLWAGLRGLPILVLSTAIRAYQLFISPWLGANCKFTPTCSAYTLEAIQKYGAIRGSFKGVWRICRCNPFRHGGYDPP